MRTTKFSHKIFLILFGTILALFFLEISFRIGGGVFKASQEYRNRVSLDKRQDYRILCLGESTTALGGQDAYPNQLEKILNENSMNIHFKVINKGIPSTTTTQILSNVDHYLDTYQPQIVVVMMGINDGASFLTVQEEMSNPFKRFLYTLRLYKFFKLLKAHLAEKFDELRIHNIKRKIEKTNKTLETHPSSRNYTKMASLYRVLLDWKAERETLLKALTINPKDAEANAYLGMNYRRSGDYEQAIEVIQKAIQYGPDTGDMKMQLYNLLVECYTLLEQYDKAREAQLKAIEEVPNTFRSYGTLGDLYVMENRCELAKPLYQQQLETNPTDTSSFIKLAYCLKKEGRLRMTEKLLEKGIEFNPKSAYLHTELGSLLLEEKEYQEAESILKKSLTLENDFFEGTDINIYDMLLKAYQAQGKVKEAREAEEILEAQTTHYNFEPYKNYQGLQQKLSKSNTLLVAVQYPMRDVQRLKNLLKLNSNVIVVDNEAIFKKAVEEKSFDYYFVDRFAGDFGHCTPAGNRLLAQNIAKNILNAIPQEHR